MSELFLFVRQFICRHRWMHHMGDINHFEACGNGNGLIIPVTCAKCGINADVEL